jgi:hypothetical protein
VSPWRRPQHVALGGLSLILVASSAFAVTALGTAPASRADVVAYLVNVTARPGYNFPDADAAVNYGHGLCDKVAGGQPYGALMTDVKRDFQTSDEFQASYLINQAVNELCPKQIWQLRQSAGRYRPGG